MTESVRSVNVIVKLYLKGHDLSNDSITDAINNMDYNFSYSDNYVRIIDSEIVDTFVSEPE
jgi:hypothetical protein